MRKRFWLSAASFLLACVTSVFVASTPAQAATTGWPQDVTDMGNSTLLTLPNGNIVATSYGGTSSAMKTFSATGAVTSTVPQNTGDSKINSFHAAASKDGTVFSKTEDYNNGKYAVVAHRGATKLWERTLTKYCSAYRLTVDRAINRIVVGNDGFVYVISLANLCYDGDYLTKLNATTGTVVFERQLSRSSTMFLAATSKGLVAQDNDKNIRFVGYNNTDFAASVKATGYVQSADMNARAFAVGSGTDSCSTSTLRMHTPGTATPFTFSIPTCWQIQNVQATSQNGLAATGYNQNGKPILLTYTANGSAFTARSIVLPDTDGHRSFKALDQFGSYLNAFLQTDVNGNILVVRPYEWKRDEKVLQGWQFTLYNLTTTVVSEYDTSAFDFQQPTAFARGATWAMAKDRLYVSVGYCTSEDPYQCGTRSTKLYAARMARLNMDYPRATVLGATASTITCRPVTFVGVRGSGEDPFAFEGLGESVQHVKDRLAAGVLNMEVIAVAYPATPVNFQALSYPNDYEQSVTVGMQALAAVLVQVNRDCPQSQIAVVAYSQGAHATDSVQFLPAAVQKQIKVMTLLGDPIFNPKHTSVNRGTFQAGYSGIWVDPLGPGKLPERQFSTAMNGKVASYCIADDPVCNFDFIDTGVCHFNPARCQHTQYKPTWTQEAATWTRSKITP